MEQKYIKIKTNKTYELLQTSIPVGIEYQLLTQTQWDTIVIFHQLHLNELQYTKIDSTTLIPYIDTATQLVDTQKAKEAEIRKACTISLDAIVTPYLPQERETWQTELSEAIAWVANNAIVTPFIDAAIAASQAIYPFDTKILYVNDIITKAAAYKAATGSIIGKRRGKLKQIYDPAATVISVQAIIW